MRLRLRSPLILAVFVLPACALLGNLRMVRPEHIRDAAARGDVAFLQRVCTGDARVESVNHKIDACNEMKKLTAVANGTCADFRQRYAEAPKGDQEFVTTMARNFAKCGFFREIFEEIAHWGSRREGAQILAAVERSGVPLEAEFVKYATANTGAKFLPFKHANYALDHIATWLLRKGSKQHCALLANAVTDGSEAVRVWVLPYAREAKCKEGAAIAKTLLLSDVARHRTWACDALGDVGDASALKKLTLLAQTDTFSEVREQRGGDNRIWAVRVFPVREACTAALGKVRLRGE